MQGILLLKTCFKLAFANSAQQLLLTLHFAFVNSASLASKLIVTGFYDAGAV